MNSAQDLKKSINSITIPNASKFDLTSEVGIDQYRTGWKELELQTDEIVKDIVRSSALAAFGGHTKHATKVMKHLEKWRIHAQATTEIWDRTWNWTAVKEKRDVVDSVYNWLGVKTPKEQWLITEENYITRKSDQLTKAYSALSREFDLLIVEIDTVI